jgi:CheY-like chemotaxis protein
VATGETTYRWAAWCGQRAGKRLADQLVEDMSPARTRRPVKRALVVQDDPTNAYLLVRLLTRWGYEVVQVADAQQAMQHASGWGSALVLVDNSLATEPALDLCRRINEVGPDLQVILIGGRGDEVSRARAQAAGARRVLSKPFEIRDLAECLIVA